MKRLVTVFACVLGSFALCAAASASEQVYHPVSPSFGGNPFNGTYVLQQAQAQGPGGGSSSGGQQSPDLSGLTNALNNTLSNLGSNLSQAPVVVIGGQQGVPANP